MATIPAVASDAPPAAAASACGVASARHAPYSGGGGGAPTGGPGGGARADSSGASMSTTPPLPPSSIPADPADADGCECFCSVWVWVSHAHSCRCAQPSGTGSVSLARTPSMNCASTRPAHVGQLWPSPRTLSSATAASRSQRVCSCRSRRDACSVLSPNVPPATERSHVAAQPSKRAHALTAAGTLCHFQYECPPPTYGLVGSS
mmetsp:Transcript_17773/g.45964  ORF Transcript_17773/g.45964 Transcript_17773/m.45964 type:complete len:205 (-) Transcript_17773:776-1390(-)